MDRIGPYSPCPCGSGKKYKFCCLQKQREKSARESRPSFWTMSSAEAPEIQGADIRGVGDAEAGFCLCSKGLRLMAESQFEEAIPFLRQAVAAAPLIHTAANNLALCLFVTGHLEEALRVQNESRDDSPFPNPFGQANLATFHYVAGDEVGAQRWLGEMVQVPLPSVDACVKVCETLARFKRHQAILDTADKSGYGDDPAVCFFTGVAAANLGDRPRAERDLRRVNLGHHKADMVRHYLQHLRDGVPPHTVRGDWPYLLNYEVCPLAVMEAELRRDERGWFARRIVVDVSEVFLNETADKPDDAVKMLAFAQHPAVIELLWAIVKGVFGPDSIRVEAVHSLQKRGEIDPKQMVTVLLDGERREIALTGTRLNPDFRFGGEVPRTVEKLYEKALKAGNKRSPDWEAIGGMWLKIMQEEPAYWPARYNYAVSLLHRRRRKEAETILRALVAEQPEYLFAHATLLQILTQDRRMKKAEALLKATPVPEEAHPAAMAAWLVAQTLFHEADGNDEEAFRCIRSAKEIAPDNPNVKRVWRDYEDWEP